MRGQRNIADCVLKWVQVLDFIQFPFVVLALQSKENFVLLNRGDIFGQLHINESELSLKLLARFRIQTTTRLLDLEALDL